MAFEVTLVPKGNIELGVTTKAVFTLSNVTPTIPVPGPKGDKGDKGDTGPQGPQGLPGTGVNSTDDVPEGDVNLYYTEERVEAVIAVTPPATHTHSASDITDFKDSIATILKAGTDITIDNNPTDITINADIPAVTDTTDGLMTSALKLKLDGIASGAEVNVNADWNATSGDAQILNKPNIILKAVASGTDTYIATISNVLAYNDADSYLIRFTNGNTTGATLNINGLGAKTLYKNNDGALIGGDITSGGEMLCIYNSTLNGFQCIGTAPNSLFAYVTNAETSTITKGQPVYAFGGTGDRLTVKLAYNTGDSTSAQTVGLVWSASIGANQKGLIIVQGQIDGLSLFPQATWSDGDAVYLGATAGTLTKTKPSAPNHLVYLGFVTTASNGNNGRMYVRVQNGYELQELHNVALSSPTNNNDGLFYETATSLWKNKSIPTVLGYTPENVANKSDSYTVSSSTTYPTTKAVVDGLATKLNTSLKGASNGLAELDGIGKVPTSQLPSYVDDVLEYANIGALPATGSAGIIYVTLDDNKIYRWSGTAYTVISDTIALGETSATAYRGDRGKIAYDHSQIITGNPHGTTKADIGLGNVDNTSDANKPVSTATQTALNAKVDANTAITGATKTKITYDSKGLVTAGSDATTADIADSSNRRYVTDAQLTVIGNTSGTNTGDQNVFGTIAVSGQSNVVADATNDTLTLVAGTGVSITTNATTDSITINSSTNLSLDDITTSSSITILNDTGTDVSIPLASSLSSGLISGTQYDKLTALSTARQLPPLGSTGQVLGKISGTDYAVGWIDNVVDGSVTFAKMANISNNTLIGRFTAGTGSPESVGIGSGLSNTGTTLYNTLAVGLGSNQTVIGGLNASGTLTLSSTSNATKGKIVLGSLSAYDEANDRLGIGTTSPTNTFHISKNITASSGNALIGLVNGTLTASANNDTLNGLNVNLTFSNGAFTGVNNYLQSWSNGGTLRSFVRWDGLQQWDMVNASNVNVGRIQYGYPSGNAGMAIFDWDTTNSVYFNRYNIANEGTFFYQGFHNINNLGGMALFNTTHNLVIGYTGTPTDSGFKLDVNGTIRASTSLDTPIVRGSTSASGTLTLSSTSDATKGKILFGTSAYDEVNNRLGIGTTSPTGLFHAVGTVAQVFLGQRASDNTGSANATFWKSRGTTSSPTIVQNGDAIGGFVFGAYDGSNFIETSDFVAIVDGTVSSNTVPQAIRFRTGSTVANRAERMRITSSGNILIGTTTDSGFKLDVNGTIRAQDDVTISDTRNIILSTSTGTKIGTATGQKLAFWNKTPIVQPTTAIAQAAFVQVNTTNAVSDASTFGGYTLRQIAQALINIGILQ